MEFIQKWLIDFRFITGGVEIHLSYAMIVVLLWVISWRVKKFARRVKS